jgi:hypothetical protein
METEPISQNGIVSSPRFTASVLRAGEPRLDRGLSRRKFLAQAAAGSIAVSVGCDNFEGAGRAPDGRRPVAQAGVFGFTIDLYRNGTFRVNADYRKVALCGLFAVGVVPAAGVLAGNALITLMDHANSSNYLLSVATSGLSGFAGAKLIHPSIDLDVDLAEFLKGGRPDPVPLKFEAYDDRSFVVDTKSVDDFRFAEGKWQAYGPNGQPVEFRISSTRDNSFMLVESPAFASPASYQVKRHFRSTNSGRSQPVLEGDVLGTFRSDPSRRPRRSPLKLICVDANTIQAESQYLTWDATGQSTGSQFWPFRMERIG